MLSLQFESQTQCHRDVLSFEDRDPTMFLRHSLAVEQ